MTLDEIILDIGEMEFRNLHATQKFSMLAFNPLPNFHRWKKIKNVITFIYSSA